jgi:hypothetical protein
VRERRDIFGLILLSLPIYRSSSQSSFELVTIINAAKALRIDVSPTLLNR